EVADKSRVGRARQSRPAHRALCFSITIRQQHNADEQNDQNQNSPRARLHYGSSSGAGATGGSSLNLYRSPAERKLSGKNTNNSIIQTTSIGIIVRIKLSRSNFKCMKTELDSHD